VGDVDLKASLFARLGATTYGPKWINPVGLEATVMRDPGGALVALAKPPTDWERLRGVTGPTGIGVEADWYVLHTADVDRARMHYAELCGWEFKPAIDLGELGIFHPFSWQPGGSAVGSMCDIQGRKNVHPHWLFHFRVAAFDSTITKVEGSGGRVVEPVTLPSGERIAVCEDPQGAAFALRSS
jgi:uncharacterized protein